MAALIRRKLLPTEDELSEVMERSNGLLPSAAARLSPYSATRVSGIAMSGYGQEEDVQRSHEAGFATHLTKPIDQERLIESLALAMPSQESCPVWLDRHLHVKGLLGGRASEEVVFTDVSTGAENDLKHATTLACRMVCL